MIRLFVALDLPEVNDDNAPIQFTNTQLLLDQAIPNFQPSKIFHSTLLFIGSVSESLLPTIKTAIERAVMAFVNDQKNGIANGIGGIMIQPGAHMMGKNAIVMRLIDEYLISVLVRELHQSFHRYQISHKEHEEINLHVTIGRITPENKNNIEIKRFLELLPAPIGSRMQLQESFTIHTITLYQSMQGGEYIKLAQYKI